MKLCIMALIGILAGGVTTLAAETAGTAVAETPESNMALIRAQHELLNSGHWQATLDYYTPASRNFGRPVGRTVMSRIFEDIYGTFPDYREEIVEITAVADSVILRIKSSGTHEGVGKLPVNGGLLVGVPPTHKHFEVSAIHWYKLKDGKIVDHYAVRDDAAMMQQLGLSPPPKPFDWAKFAAEANGR
jgi:predicted ester cyclase